MLLSLSHQEFPAGMVLLAIPSKFIPFVYIEICISIQVHTIYSALLILGGN